MYCNAYLTHALGIMYWLYAKQQIRKHIYIRKSSYMHIACSTVEDPLPMLLEH